MFTQKKNHLLNPLTITPSPQQVTSRLQPSPKHKWTNKIKQLLPPLLNSNNPTHFTSVPKHSLTTRTTLPTHPSSPTNSRAYNEHFRTTYVLPTSSTQRSTAALRGILRRITADAEARTTAKTRDNLWRRLQTWAAARGLCLNEETAMLFSLQHATKASSKKAYFTALSARLQPKSAKANFLRGLGRRAKAEPLHQAPIIDHATAKLLIRRAPLKIRATLHLMWRSASRLSDLMELRRSDCTITPTALALHWKFVKTTGEQPFRLQFYTRLTLSADSHLDMELYKHLTKLKRTQTVTTPAILRDIDKYLHSNQLTDHSIKRSAVTAAAKALIEKHALNDNHNLALLPAARESLRLLAKHATFESTIRYISDPTITAILSGVGAVTTLL